MSDVVTRARSTEQCTMNTRIIHSGHGEAWGVLALELVEETAFGALSATNIQTPIENR